MRNKIPPYALLPDPQEEEEIQECRALRPEERLERFFQISRLAWAFFSQSPNQQAARELRDERTAESLATWQRLMRTKPYHG